MWKMISNVENDNHFIPLNLEVKGLEEVSLLTTYNRMLCMYVYRVEVLVTRTRKD